jgi:hypothetical protein
LFLGVVVLAALSAGSARAQGTTCDLPTSVTATPNLLTFSSPLTGPITVTVFAGGSLPIDTGTATAPQHSFTLATPLAVGSTDTVHLADATCTRNITVTVTQPCPPLPTGVVWATLGQVIFNGPPIPAGARVIIGVAPGPDANIDTEPGETLLDVTLTAAQSTFSNLHLHPGVTYNFAIGVGGCFTTGNFVATPTVVFTPGAIESSGAPITLMVGNVGTAPLNNALLGLFDENGNLRDSVPVATVLPGHIFTAQQTPTFSPIVPALLTRATDIEAGAEPTPSATVAEVVVTGFRNSLRSAPTSSEARSHDLDCREPEDVATLTTGPLLGTSAGTATVLVTNFGSVTLDFSVALTNASGQQDSLINGSVLPLHTTTVPLTTPPGAFSVSSTFTGHPTAAAATYEGGSGSVPLYDPGRRFLVGVRCRF